MRLIIVYKVGPFSKLDVLGLSNIVICYLVITNQQQLYQLWLQALIYV